MRLCAQALNDRITLNCHLRLRLQRRGDFVFFFSFRRPIPSVLFVSIRQALNTSRNEMKCDEKKIETRREVSRSLKGFK